MSATAQRRKGFGIEPLKQFDARDESWQEIVVENHRVGPAEIACCRIDFSTWLRLLPRRLRKIALMLAAGETTSDHGHEVWRYAGEDFAAPLVA